MFLFVQKVFRSNFIYLLWSKFKLIELPFVWIQLACYIFNNRILISFNTTFSAYCIPVIFDLPEDVHDDIANCYNPCYHYHCNYNYDHFQTL